MLYRDSSGTAIELQCPHSSCETSRRTPKTSNAEQVSCLLQLTAISRLGSATMHSPIPISSTACLAVICIQSSAIVQITNRHHLFTRNTLSNESKQSWSYSGPTCYTGDMSVPPVNNRQAAYYIPPSGQKYAKSLKISQAVCYTDQSCTGLVT